MSSERERSEEEKRRFKVLGNLKFILLNTVNVPVSSLLYRKKLRKFPLGLFIHLKVQTRALPLISKVIYAL